MKYDTDLTAVQVGQAVANLLRLGDTVATGNAARKILNTQSIAQEE